MDPFTIRGARIPDPSPFPSTVGSSIMRYNPPVITDTTLATRRVSALWFGLDAGVGGPWTATLTAVDSTAGTDAWATSQHPHQADFSANFQLLRSVSMGIRVINAAELFERGGALYVSHTTVKPGQSDSFDRLKLSSETVVYDSTNLPVGGLEAHWIPLSRTPVQLTGTNLTATAQTYSKPFVAASSFLDSSILVWLEGTSTEDLNLAFEQVHNWESIPFPQTEFMFDRLSVVGSEDTNAIALSTVGGSTAAHPPKTPNLWGEIGNLAMKGVKQFGSSLAPIAMQLVSSYMSTSDYQNHVLAVHCGCPQSSPLVCEAYRGLSVAEMLEKLRVENQWNVLRLENPEEFEEKYQAPSVREANEEDIGVLVESKSAVARLRRSFGER